MPRNWFRSKSSNNPRDGGTSKFNKRTSHLPIHYMKKPQPKPSEIPIKVKRTKSMNKLGIKNRKGKKQRNHKGNLYLSPKKKLTSSSKSISMRSFSQSP